MINDDEIFEILKKHKEFGDYFWKKKCNKGSVTNVFVQYVNSNRFLEHLDDMKNKLSDYNRCYGMIFSDDYDDPYDEFYFGENNPQILYVFLKFQKFHHH